MTVRAIRGGPVPNAAVITELKELLALAESGELQAIAYACEYADGRDGWCWTGCGSWLTIGGRLQWLTLHLLNQEEGVEDEE